MLDHGISDASSAKGGEITDGTKPDLRRWQSDPMPPVEAAKPPQAAYSQELERNYSLSALGALCVTLMATWEALSTALSPALVGGSAPCVFYN